MQVARNGYPYLEWLWEIYDNLLNRDQSAPFLIATRTCTLATFNGARLTPGRELVRCYQGLRAAITRRSVKLDRASFDFDVVIGPETFANCASLWWTVDSTPGAPCPNDCVHGATQILFRDNHEILQIRDIWSPLP